MLGLETVLVGLSTTTSGIKLPKYFHKCNFNDRHLDQCISDAANLATTKLVKDLGNKDFDLPPLSLFNISNVHSPYNSSFKFNLVQASAGYLEDVRFVFSRANLKAATHNGTAYFPQLNIYGYYDIDGKIGESPVSGSGLAYIIFSDVYWNLLWNFEIVKRNGTDYIKVRDLTLNYDVKGSQYSLADLFVAGEFLEADGNEYLNRNWIILAKIIAASVMHGIRGAALKIMNVFTEKVSLQEMSLTLNSFRYCMY